MDPETWKRIEEVFFAALDQPVGGREAYLERACAGRPGLLAEVRALLAAHESGAPLAIEQALLAEGAAAAGAHAGMRAGPWRLLRELGRGGMGDVWLAERADGGYQQQAAVKLVRSGWRPAELLARFRRERQVLARLVHPNIATLLDGGSAEDGSPYLAMEYVEGRTITAWCRERALGLRERLRVFLQVVDAVRFAHANLVVHRDLKPANILVTAEGRPVLLDFGIAKLLAHDDGDALLTREEDRLLTPEHAAPEQLRGEAATAATDVWGLGVLLYELLAGVRPFRAPGATRAEVERRVLEDEPARPSAALATLLRAGGEAGAAPAGARPADLRGDLDAIALAALRKDPARRYRSAEQLGEDVERWLRGLPVRARPDAFGYRTGKYVRRHRVGVAATVALGLSLLAFAVVATVQARRIAHERDRAQAEEKKSERALDVLVNLFKLSDPRTVPGGDTLRMSDALRVAEGRIDEVEDQPEIQARLWGAMAAIHASHGEVRAQRAALERGIAAAHRSGAIALELHLRCIHALIVSRTEESGRGARLVAEARAECERRFGPASLPVAEALEYETMILGTSDRTLALLDRALAIRRQRQPGDSREKASLLSRLGYYWMMRANFDRALASYDEQLRMLERLLPRDHPDVLQVRHNIAMTLCRQGEFQRTLEIEQEILPIRRRLMGANTADAAGSLHGIGLALANLGHPAAAADSLAEAFDILVRIMGRPERAAHLMERELTLALARSGHAAEARARLAGVIARTQAWPPEDAADVWTLRMMFAGWEQAAGGTADLDSLRAALEHVRAARGAPPRVLLEGVVAMGAAKLGAGGPHAAAAETLFAEAAAIGDSTLGPRHPLRACIRSGLLAARAAAGRPIDRAELRASWASCRGWGELPDAMRAPVERLLAAR